ncbi:M15 family metallopeptidase [Streptomyces albidoflavus]|uniref:M15 family metallopeptidase n=1 Tax=Streptomyces albidoflavus TaxID=1886 RepID=UPI0033CD16BA
MEHITLMSDPTVAAIPVEECGEPLVDLVHLGGGSGLRVDDRKRDPHGAYAHLRAGVLDRLHQAERQLPAGFRLLIVEGYRPPALQRAYFDAYLAELRAQHRDWDAAQLRTAASRYVSPPEIAPHSAGAAVDLTLTDADGTELDLGTRLNASPEESGGACFTDAPGLGPAARRHRAVLAAALTGAGLCNYPTEWWHWSYGDRYWALTTGAPAALYGPVDLGS